MKKRIFSIVLAVSILLSVMPMALFSVSAQTAAADAVLTEPLFPKTVETSKSANNFPADAGTYIALNNGVTGSANWDPGVTADASEYASFTTDGEADATVSVEPGKATLTSVNEAAFNLALTFKSSCNADTNFIALHIDTTGLTANAGAELQMNGATGGAYYCIKGATYYFLPDATEENPNPEREVRTTINSGIPFQFYPNEKGTLYIPETVFGADADYSAKMAEGWNLWHSGRKFAALRLSFKFGFKTGESIVFSDMRWVTEKPFELDYNAEMIVEDCDDDSNLSVWGSYDFAGSSAIQNGKWVHTVSSDAWTEGYCSSYAPSVNLPVGITDGFSALRFDVDYSDFEVSFGLQITYYVKNTNVSGNAVRSYVAANGPIYTVDESGNVKSLQLHDSAWAKAYLPAGFKGTVVVPFDTFKRSDAYDSVSNTDLFKTDDVNAYGLELLMYYLPIEEKGSVAVYDNIGYLTTIAPPYTEGTSFPSETKMDTDVAVTEDIATVGAWVKIPEGAVAGNFLADKYHISQTVENGKTVYITSSITVGINDAGAPLLYMTDGKGNEISFAVSGLDIRNNKWTHIAFTKNTENDTVSCYINGLLEKTVAIAAEFGQVIPYHTLTIGHTVTPKLAVSDFSGEICDLKLYNRALSAVEIAAFAQNPAALADGIIAAWSLSGDNALTDIVSGNDFAAYKTEIGADDAAYAEYSAAGDFSMAIIPDTQIANYLATTADKQGFSEMYDWLVANKDAQNIKFVMGLGDITDKDTDAEYQLAKAGYDKLTAAGIPWSVVGGNHDFAGASVGPADSSKLNQYFPASEISTFAHFGGFMSDGKIDNAYYYVTVNNIKYLILCLEVEPKDETLMWANQVCMNNSDCKVIVTTHSYLTRDAVPATSSYTGRTGDRIWDKLLSRQENIIMAISGHVDVPDIQHRVLEGKNGNKVLNMLIDAQALDYAEPSYNMIAMLKFSQDGSSVTVNYYSPTRDCYLDAESQFTAVLYGTVTDAPAEPEKSDYTSSRYYAPEVVRNFKYFSLTKSELEFYESGGSVANLTNDNVSWDNQRIKVTMPSSYNDDAYKASANLYIKKLPNVVDKDYKAISFWVDTCSRSATTYIKLQYNLGLNGTMQLGTGSIYYLLAEDGSITEKTNDNKWSSVTLPAGFKGTVLVPFSSWKLNYGDGEFAADTDIYSEEDTNSSFLIITMLDANPSNEFIFNNISFLKEYNAESLAEVCKDILSDGKVFDVNGDGYFDIRDIVRLKKVLAS